MAEDGRGRVVIRFRKAWRYRISVILAFRGGRGRASTACHEVDTVVVMDFHHARANRYDRAWMDGIEKGIKAWCLGVDYVLCY